MNTDAAGVIAESVISKAPGLSMLLSSGRAAAPSSEAFKTAVESEGRRSAKG